MAEKPILSNTEMVRAILEGRKTVTRRVVKPQPMIGSTIYPNIDVAGKVCAEIWGNGAVKHIKQPYHRGDILWVRETWLKFPAGGYAYKADANSNSEKLRVELGYKWHPSIHMPREAARIWLRVTDVRVEQLQTEFFKQESTIFELRAEGIDIGETCRECISAYGRPCCNDEDTDDGSECGMLDDVRDDFARLWDGTIKPADRERYGWAANPWVWVIEFERTERPVTPT